MGYYVDSPKMDYKSQFGPAYVMCPQTYQFVKFNDIKQNLRGTTDNQQHPFNDGHHEASGKLENESFSVFNRKQLRKQKKEIKQKRKIDFNNREHIKQRLLQQQKLKEEQERKKQEELQKQQEQLKKKQQKIVKVPQKDNKKTDKLSTKSEKKRERKYKIKEEIQKQIEQDEQEIRYLEQKLGFGTSKKKEKETLKELKNEGFEEDLFDFLNNIDTVYKKRQVDKNYQPFKKIEDELKEDQGMFYEEFQLSDSDSNFQKYVEVQNQTSNDENEQDTSKNQYSDNEEEEDQQNEQEDENYENLDDDDDDLEEDLDDEEELENSDLEVDFQDDEDIEESQSYENEEEELSDEGDEIEDSDIEREIQRRMESSKQEKLDKKKKDEQKIQQKTDFLYGFDLQKQKDEEKKKMLEEKEQAKKNQEQSSQQKQSQLELQQKNLRSLSSGQEKEKQEIQIFEEYPKTLCSPALAQITIRSIINPLQVLNHIVSTQSAILVAIHDIFGAYSFSMIMKSLLDKYNELKQQKYNDEINQAEDEVYQQKKNLINLFCHLFIFNSLSIDFVRGIFEDLIQEISEKNIELLLLLISYTGHKIRADSPATLKYLVQHIKTKIEKYQQENTNYSKKIDFILLTLNDIKMNKKQQSNPVDRLSFLMNWLKKGVQQKFKLSKNIFSLDFQTSLTIDKGINKWWEPLNNITTLDKIIQQEGEMNKKSMQQEIDEEIYGNIQVSNSERKKLEQLAIKNKFVSVTRKQIFMIIMSSEDVLDASQKLMKLKLNKNQNREIAVVITLCCQNEKTYNPYYYLLAKKLIEINKTLKYGFQYSLWDRFKQLDEINIRKIGNLAKFSASLAASGSQNLSLVKFFNLELPDEKIVFFVNFFLKEFLMKVSANILNKQIENTKKNKENLTFIDIFRDYLKQQFLPWAQQQNKEELQKGYVLQKTNFTIKKLKIQNYAQEIEEGEDDIQ
ncbi:Armadillo-type fold [Pseudocohnilembus persalinus]|uniref:Armadillo-type fold n=1 Tax=Pseudocohnilembus persalinus TaxID=266149 RepID=A0A0V0QRE4_PSEPJ|nr:Armadillo-type fold [Pseudocohnilembus persalinus]|eukprot:KRX04570.1 Armadillo-type fold [Pseudocohnilembus persalinus]